jgi:hypothetical protein
MSERIRLGNVYSHDEYGDVLTVHKDHDNTVWFRPVEARDNAGVISTGDGIEAQGYKQFLGSVSMRDYPEDWERKAAAIRKRDDNTCQGCGATDAPLQVHHIVPLGAGGSNARSNLITLCESCHGRVHGGVC